MSIEACKEKLDLYREELNDLKSLDTNEMLRFLIMQGDKLKPIDDAQKTEQTKVSGCISQVHIIVREENGRAKIYGSSEAMVVKGFLGVLADACSELSTAELCTQGQELIADFLLALDLNIILTPSRANTFGNVIKFIIDSAAA